MDKTMLFDILVTGAMLITAGILIPVAKEFLGELKFNKIQNIISIAVSAAEQIYRNDEKAGEDKFNYVVNKLNDLGIKLSKEELKMYIESAVQILQGNKKVEFVGEVEEYKEEK